MPVIKTLRIVVPTVLAATAITLTSAPASAAAYGEVTNRTNKEMEYASFSGAGRIHRCDVWNDTRTARSANFRNLKCKQVALKPGKKARPEERRRGFTFERNSYHLYMQRVPKGRYVDMGVKKKDVWTKITNLDDAICKNAAVRPKCFVRIG